MTTVAELLVADDPAAWRTAGFTVDDAGVCRIGTVAVRLDPSAGSGGVRAWTLAGAPDETVDDIEGVATSHGEPPDGGPPSEHANGAVMIDHVVLVTPDLPRTIDAIERRLGAPCRRIRETDSYGAPMRQAFFRLGEVILEVVGGAEPDPKGGKARFYGLALTVRSLDDTKALLGDRIGTPKPAVQPGRQITSIRPEAGLRVPIALMSPEPAEGASDTV